MNEEALIDALNDLIRAAEDNHLALQRAGDDLEEEAWAALCTDLAARRAGMIRALQERVAAIGGAPDATGTLIGGARRMVGELGVALGAFHADDILESLVELQEHTIARIRQTEERDLPPPVKAELDRMVTQLTEDRDRLAAAHASAVEAEEKGRTAEEQGG